MQHKILLFLTSSIHSFPAAHGEEDQHVRVTEDIAFINNILQRFKACRVAFTSLEMDPFSPISPPITAPSSATVIVPNSSSPQTSAHSPSRTAAPTPTPLLSKLKPLRDDEIPEDIILKAAVRTALSTAPTGTVPLSIRFAAEIDGVDVVNPSRYTYRIPRGSKSEVKKGGVTNSEHDPRNGALAPESKEECKGENGRCLPSIFDTPHALILCMRSCGLAAPSAFSKAHSVNQKATINKQVRMKTAETAASPVHP